MSKEKRKKLETKDIIVTYSLDEVLNSPLLNMSPEELLKQVSPKEIEDIKNIQERLKNEILKIKQDKEKKRLLDRSRSGN